MSRRLSSTWRGWLLGLAMAVALPSMARAQAGDTVASEMTDGEVRKVDREAGKLTLRHGEIRNLDMPPMTMVFTVKDKALLDKLQPGDKVKFRAVKEGGRIVVTQIETGK